jgi:hypothetical protein
MTKNLKKLKFVDRLKFGDEYDPFDFDEDLVITVTADGEIEVVRDDEPMHISDLWDDGSEQR